MDISIQEARARPEAPMSLPELSAEFMQKHRRDDSQASLTLSVLEVKGLKPRKGVSLDALQLYWCFSVQLKCGTCPLVGVPLHSRP